MSTIAKASNKTAVKLQQANIKFNDDLQKINFLQEVIEILENGILIISIAGELIYANTSGYDFCYQINQGIFELNCISPIIWSLCQTLINNQRMYPEKNVVISDQIVIDKFKKFRICVKSLNLKKNTDYLLVIIDNHYQTFEKTELTEIHKYDFTPREDQIWRLYRAKFTYKEIAIQLHITINTVKKHMKNIHLKINNSNN
ncbi:MAG: helix-turn-helix transcriptional regulator [Nostoc sp. S4]|nr:helix-turn-helix transcriptional regulator [Nostoc sp. S4]